MGFWRTVGIACPEPDMALEPCLRTLFHNGNSSKLFIATLVAQAFVTNPKPNVYKYVRYKDGNSANNHWSNLEWCRNQTGSKYGKS